MFRKTKRIDHTPKLATTAKQGMPSIFTSDICVVGNLIAEGAVDFGGKLDGNVRCQSLIVRADGAIKGEVVADLVQVYGKIKGLIRAKHVHLFPTCQIEGIVMHESISIEDGAFIDGKCKRTDKIQQAEEVEIPPMPFAAEMADDEPLPVQVGLMKNIRLIAQ